jgi:ring-1,2-phenylacetyl-CoA epoxidase subunit PaaC
MLCESSYQPLADLSRKITAELRYHTLHANTWIKQLGTATEESISRLQKSLDAIVPYALGIFEESPYEGELIEGKIFGGEHAVRSEWMTAVEEVISKTDLKLPDWKIQQPVLGGRAGKHSEYLQPLLDEMSEVFRIDPTAEW